MTDAKERAPMAADEVLRPCPFCDGEAMSENYAIEAGVRCLQCKAKIIRPHSARDDNGLPESIAAWNTRTAVAALVAERDALRGDAAELVDVLHRAGFVRCDTACMCGSWHHRYGAPERLNEIYDLLRDAGYISNATGNLASNGLRRLIEDKEQAESALAVLAELAKRHEGHDPLLRKALLANKETE